MTAEQFLKQLSRNPPAPAYLFVGSEFYQRNRCRKALVEAALNEADREGGVTRLDLGEISLIDVLDDARSMSLFAANRLIWVSSAELALPGGRSKKAEEAAGADQLAAYLQDPSPGVVLVFEASRFDLEGEGKKKADRVRKFYSAIRDQVDFPPYTQAAAQTLARQLASDSGVRLGQRETALLVEATGADAARIATEIEKLRLFAGEGGEVTEEQIASLVPSARAATIFALVAALGAGDRAQALDLIDTLVSEGEYLPLALTFLGAQFRHALVAKEARLRGARDIQSHFQKLGVPMWPSKARQVQETLAAFSTAQLRTALQKVYRADYALRDARPDDRTILEQLVLSLTA